MSHCGLPLDGGGGPGEAGAEGDHDDLVAALEALGAVGLVEGDGDGGSGGVAILVEVDEDTLVGDREAVGDGVDDAQVGLVGQDELDVVGGEAGALDDGVGRDCRKSAGTSSDAGPNPASKSISTCPPDGIEGNEPPLATSSGA